MICAILLLAGSSSRTGLDLEKQFFVIKGKEAFLYPLLTLMSAQEISSIILVAKKERFDLVNESLKKIKKTKQLYVIEGGETRKKSVSNALEFIKHNLRDIDYCLIHDSARVLVSKEIIEKNIEEVKKSGATTTYIKPTNAIAINENSAPFYLDRNKLIEIQTPQAFKFDLIYKAHKQEIDSLDDLSLTLKYKNNVSFIEGNAYNFKVTTREELEILKKLL